MCLREEIERLEMYSDILAYLTKEIQQGKKTKKDIISLVNVILPLIEVLECVKRDIICIIDFM